MKTIKLLLLGHGTVGRSVRSILETQSKRLSEHILRRTGELVELSIQSVLVKDKSKHPECPLITSDEDDAFHHDYDILIELIGGVEPATSFIKRALNEHKDVVTANKQALFLAQGELEELARNTKQHLQYEAAVAGAIPILRSLNSLVSGRVTKLQGIINGSTNYILTRVAEGLELNEAFAEATSLGYLEADPSSDVDGFDALYKLGILTYLATGVYPKERDIERQGIREIDESLINEAKRNQQKIKLIATADFEAGEYSVKPELVIPTDYLYHVDGAVNGLSLTQEHAGALGFQGLGAGGNETASAVIGNIVDIVCERVRSKTW